MKKDLNVTEFVCKREGNKIINYWLLLEYLHRLPSDRSQVLYEKVVKSDALSSCVSHSIHKSWVEKSCLNLYRWFEFPIWVMWQASKESLLPVCELSRLSLEKFSLLNQLEIKFRSKRKKNTHDLNQDTDTRYIRILFAQILISCQMTRK